MTKRADAERLAELEAELAKRDAREASLKAREVAVVKAEAEAKHKSRQATDMLAQAKGLRETFAEKLAKLGGA